MPSAQVGKNLRRGEIVMVENRFPPLPSQAQGTNGAVAHMFSLVAIVIGVLASFLAFVSGLGVGLGALFAMQSTFAQQSGIQAKP